MMPNRKRVWRIIIVLAVVIIAIPLAWWTIGKRGVPRKRVSGKPNIIIINADDLGYGDIGVYGQQLFKTPNLDRMAAQGKRFTDFYAGCSVCSPSRACLISGKDTGHVSIRQNTVSTLSLNDKTIAEVLKPAGYRCGVVGKWGIGDPGTTGDALGRGFDSLFGYYNLGEDPYPPTVWKNRDLLPVLQGTFQEDLLIKGVFDFIKENQDGPFFLYFAPTIVHGPYVVPDAAPYTDMLWSKEDKAYAALIGSYLDRDIGELFKLLKELQLEQDTVVFFTSDNGPPGENFFHSAGPFGGVKRTLREGGLRVPLIVRWPGHINRGGVETFGPTETISSEPLGNWDLLPTIAELAEVDIPSGINGKSFLPTLLERQQNPHEFLYWEFPFKKGRWFSQAVRVAEWKLIRTITPVADEKVETTIELFNLQKDMTETTNLAADFPELVRKMLSIMDREHVDLGSL